MKLENKEFKFLHIKKKNYDNIELMRIMLLKMMLMMTTTMMSLADW